MSALKRVGLDTAELVAATDPRTFRFLAESEGFQVMKLRERDPLLKRALQEDVTAIAATIQAHPGEPDQELDHYQSQLQEIAGRYGYILSH